MWSTVTANTPEAPIDIDLWRRGSVRLVECSGRAQVHDLRNALNAVAIGVELLARDDLDQSQSDRNRSAASVRQEIGAAGAAVAGLSTLFAETVAPSFNKLPDVILWALKAAEPVARRRGVDLTSSHPAEGVPEVDLPAGASVALALLLVESCLTARRGTGCATRLTSNPVSIAIEWQSEAEGESVGLELAQALFRNVMRDVAAITVGTGRDFRRIVAVLARNR